MKTHQRGNNQLFILSDAGMGKTSFLVMFKLLHFTSFWPKDYNCILMKIGEETIYKLEETENKRQTVLLLDSLDEDPLAYGRTKERLLEILEVSSSFYRVIITCRTQFFPYVDKDPLEYPGRIRVGGYVCPSKYISLFDDIQVDEYLEKRFPPSIWGFSDRKEKITEAKSIVDRMSSLRCRPMLLSFIEDLINSPSIFVSGSEYLVYNALVNNWLLREEVKTGFDSHVLLRACAELAYKMQSRKLIKIPQKELDKLIEELSYLGSLKSIDITGRSLLNRNSAGEYRFAHYSIQEFLVVYYIFNYVNINNDVAIYPTDFIKRLIEQNKQQLKIRLQNEMIDYQYGIETTHNPFLDIDKHSFQTKSEVSDLVKDLIPDLDDLEIEPFEATLDIPTFLRRKIAISREENK